MFPVKNGGAPMVCAFTGHRKIPPEHRQGLTELLQSAIAHAYDLGCRKFIAGGALGFDTEAAREVIRFRISHPDVHLALYLPCIGQDISWSDRQRALYDYTLNCANEVRYVSENYDPDCMRRRNYAMAEECGFSDNEYFSRCFKNYHGMSPTTWKKTQKSDATGDKQ